MPELNEEELIMQSQMAAADFAISEMIQRNQPNGIGIKADQLCK